MPRLLPTLAAISLLLAICLGGLIVRSLRWRDQFGVMIPSGHYAIVGSSGGCAFVYTGALPNGGARWRFQSHAQPYASAGARWRFQSLAQPYASGAQWMSFGGSGVRVPLAIPAAALALTPPAWWWFARRRRKGQVRGFSVGNVSPASAASSGAAAPASPGPALPRPPA